MELVGYKLIRIEDGEVINTWGGQRGHTPAIPNPLFIHAGLQVSPPELEVEYEGYKLVEWFMGPLPVVIDKVTMAQARLALLQAGLLDTVQQIIDAGDAALKIEWEYRTEIRRDASLVIALASQLNLTDEQVDELFLQASQL
jgi:hypothetical protein